MNFCCKGNIIYICTWCLQINMWIFVVKVILYTFVYDVYNINMWIFVVKVILYTFVYNVYRLICEFLL